MSAQARKKPRDLNLLAAAIVDEATGEDASPSAAGEEGLEKDPAAVSLGRKGGLKGGRARATKLSPKRRREIAKKAAAARWAKEPPKPKTP